MKKFKSFVFVLLVAFLAFLPLFFGYIFYNDDTVTYDYPVFSFYHKSISNGESPLWNPNYFSGFPSHLSPVGSLIDPLNILLLNTTPDFFTAYHLRFFISIFLGLFFTYLFSRSRGLSGGATVILSLTYLLAQTIEGQTSGLINSGSFFVMPALLLVVDRISKNGNFLRWVTLGSLFLAYGWISGFVQTVFYSVFLAIIYALFRGIEKKSEFKISIFRESAALFLVVFMSVILAFPLLYDTTVFRELTPRVSGFGEVDPGGVYIGNVINFILPDYFLIPFLSKESISGLYFGGVSFVLIILSLFFIKKEKETAFSVGLYLGVLALMIEPLGLSKILQMIPVFSTFHTIERMLMPASFFVAYASSISFDLIRSDRRLLSSVWLPRFLAIFVSLILLIGATLTVLPGVFHLENLAVQSDLLKKILEFLDRDIETLSYGFDHYLLVFSGLVSLLTSDFSFLNWRFASSIFILTLASLLVVLYRNEQIKTKSFSVAVIILVVANFLSYHAGVWNMYIDKDLALESPKIVLDIENNSRNIKNTRVISFLASQSLFESSLLKSSGTKTDVSKEWFVGVRDSLSRNLNTFYEIPRVDGYEAFRTKRQIHFFEEVLNNENFSLVDGENLADAKKRVLSNLTTFLPTLSTYNTEFIISGSQIKDGRLEIIKDYSEELGYNLFLYKNKNVLPMVFVPDNVKIVNSWSDSYFGYVNNSLRNNAVIECSVCEEVEIEQEGEISEVIFNGDYLRFATDLSKETWVFISVSNSPFWEARVNQEVVDVYISNYLMQALRVPKGKNLIEFEYKPFASKLHGY